MILGEGNALYATNGPILLRFDTQAGELSWARHPPTGGVKLQHSTAGGGLLVSNAVASSTLTPTETALTFLGPYPPQFWETLASPNPIYSITAPRLRFCSGTHNSAGPATSLQSKTALPTGAVLWSSL